MAEQHLFEPPPPDPNYKPSPKPTDPFWRVNFSKEASYDVVVQAPNYEAAEKMADELVEDDENWRYVEWDYNASVFRKPLTLDDIRTEDSVFAGGEEKGEWTDGKTLWKQHQQQPEA